ncbi:hypothetical protein GCM10009118_10060 [Wandonia haliotis]|uniref:Uncharacterized protein n=1 Tax=Wandonia haliotis TaxID=574963 RepID=A0ABP3Y1T3_9FLAO
MLPDYGQGATQMFSQRNNPYCELLQIQSSKYEYYNCEKQKYFVIILVLVNNNQPIGERSCSVF